MCHHLQIQRQSMTRILLERWLRLRVSGDCVIVADDSIPYGNPLAERRVNLSSIRCPKMGNPRRDEKPAPYACEAMEFLRTRLIGRQVNVQMKYSRKVAPMDGSVVPSGAADSRVMDFGSVFLSSSGKVDCDDTPPAVRAGSQQTGVNVAELIVGHGFGTVIRHRDFEERSNHYEAILAAESRAISGRKDCFVVDIMVETYQRDGHFVQDVLCRGLFVCGPWLSSLRWKCAVNFSSEEILV